MNPARLCEDTHAGHEPVSIVKVPNPRGDDTTACTVGAPMAMALQRANLDLRRGLCPSGGEHYFERIDPRDERQLGMSGWHCAECGKGRDA